jgi:alkylation response protein AidB-like acyl-CoA dehydrogenase
MSVQALRQPPAAAAEWRAILAEIGPRLAEEERRADEARDFAAANFTLLRERGFLELAVPTDLGGRGLGMTELSDMLRTLAQYGGATALALSMHTHATYAAAWRWRNQKAPVDALLRKIAAERIQLLSSGGSDWLKGSGKAEKVDGGYRIHARKVFASGAPAAHLYMTGAIEETADGPSVLQFGIPMNAQGVSIAETWDTLGMRGSGSHDVVLDGVFVPDAAVSVRRKPGAWHPLLHIVTLCAFPLVYSVYTGIAEAARDIAVEAVRKRSDADTVELVGALDTELQATRLTLDAMVAFAETAQPGPATSNTIFMHRVLVARSALKTVDLAIDVAGGAAYFRKLGLERHFRDIQGARFHPIAGAPQRRLAGRMALGLPIDA